MICFLASKHYIKGRPYWNLGFEQHHLAAILQNITSKGALTETIYHIFDDRFINSFKTLHQRAPLLKLVNAFQFNLRIRFKRPKHYIKGRPYWNNVHEADDFLLPIRLLAFRIQNITSKGALTETGYLPVYTALLPAPKTLHQRAPLLKRWNLHPE